VKRIIPPAMLPGLPRGEHLGAAPEEYWQDLDCRPIKDMPDWSKEAAYPRPDELSRRGWGWEFLRRNPLYQADWTWNELRPARWGLVEAIDPGISPYEPALLPGFVVPPGFRVRVKYYPTYLRVFDARCAGAKIAEIGAAIYPDEAGADDAVKKDIKAALRLVWFDYEALLGHN
jgi:hypothetical protein